ncbi:MAG: discoidin domain-containing protein [Phycisphaeraceae bacterium JB051]
MFKFVSRLVIPYVLLLTATLCASELTLLSNNLKPGQTNSSFPSETVVKPTTMKVAFVTDGEYATDEESVKTGKEGKVLFDGNTGSNWKSRTYSKWSGGKWVTVNVDLGQPYDMNAFDVWAIHEYSRQTESFEVLTSDDGQTLKSQGIATCPDIETEKNKIAQLHLQLASPVTAQYVQIRIKRKGSTKQQQIGEIAIWNGYVADGVTASSSAKPAAKPVAASPAATAPKTAASIDTSGLALLSNNIKPGKTNAEFGENFRIEPTAMQVSFVTDGEFASDEESVKTGNEGKVLFDGNTGSNWKSRTYSKWGGKRWVTINVDLGAAYALSAFDVWAIHEKSRETAGFQVLLSDVGKTFTPHGAASTPDIELAKNTFARTHLDLSEPVKARYVQIRIERKKSAKQQQVAEIAIWGSKPVEGVSYLKSDSRPKVAFEVTTIQSGVAKIDWSQSTKLDVNVKQWKVYQSDKAFTSIKDSDAKLIKSVNGSESHTVVYPLKPGHNYFFAVTAVYDQGEYPQVNTIATRMPMPLECRTFGDMVAINHFWGGGGHRVNHAQNQDAYERIAVDLLGQTGIKHIRWWVVDSNVFNRYYDKGIGVYAYPHGGNLQAATNLGVNAFAGAKNEPDLSTMPIENYIKRTADFHAKMKSINPDAVMCAPSSGLEDHSINWLDKFYQQGGKDCFDVLDLHTYTKIAGGHKVPDGYPKGAPEAMYDNMRKINSVLARHGDQDKPIISTEFGYTDAPVNNPSGKVTLQTQAEYLVRGLVIHHALNFKRVFIYSFWDSGNDLNFTEHRFGMIDHDLQKKPSFFAVKTLIDQLGQCQLKGKMDNLSLPSIGYVYKHPSDDKLVHILWDGTQRKTGVFQTTAKSVTQVDLFGNTTDLMPDENGKFSATFGHAPIYLHADKPIRFISSQIAKAQTSDAPLTVQLVNKQIIALPESSQAMLKVSLDNPRNEAITLNLIVTDEQANKLAQQQQVVKANAQDTVMLSIPTNANMPTLGKYTLNVIEQQASGMGGKVSTYPFFMRRLHLASSKAITTKANIAGLDEPVMILTNDQLEVAIDAARGGRVLEIIDRESASNQIHIDYGILPNITSIPFAFGIWDTFNGKLKNDPMQATLAKDGKLTVTAEAKGLQVTQSWELKGADLVLNISVHNPSSNARKFSYQSHPEYTVGGTGDSVTDVIYLPMSDGLTKLPFWTGLGDKPVGDLSANWWAALDTQNNIALKQTYTGNGLAKPRLWFGQGHYNVELITERNFEIAAGQTWQAQFKWSVIKTHSGNIEQALQN